MGKVIKMGIIGAGLWGNVHGEIYSTHPSSVLTAVCDLNREQADAVSRKYGNPDVYTDYREMLRKADIDAVAVVTPDFAHAAPIIAACEAGKHVLVEKPLATTREDLAAIRKAVESANIKLMVDYHNRWNPPIALARDDIREGKLGTIMSAYYRLNDVISVPLEMLSWSGKSSILWFLGSHTVDTLRFLFDDEVARVYSVSRSVVLKERGLMVPDLYQTILEFRGGPVATIENNWIVPNSNPFINDIKANILGSRGMLDMDISHNNLYQRFLETGYDHPDCIIKPRIFGQTKGFACESIRHFIEALSEGKDPMVGLEDGVRVSQVILSIFESAKTRQSVEVQY